MNTSRLKKRAFIQTRLGLAALGSILALTAGAQDFDMDSPFYKPFVQKQAFGISPFYGYRFGGEVEDFFTGTKYSFEDAPAYGLFLDYAPEGIGRLEVLWSHQDSSINF